MATKPNTPPAPLATQIRDLLSKATPDDVKALDEQIEAKQKEIDDLKSDRKLIAQAAGVEETKKRGGWPRKPKVAEATAPSAAKPSGQGPNYAVDLTDKRKKALIAVRAAGNGGISMDTLAARTGINRQGPGNLASVIAYEWFHLSPEGYVTTTDKGDRVKL